ncbi:hypothetical protein P3G55_17100 [Leptospira sp. 96542]|nr:hypothetical protein [Leptospira sp. 96542]
MQLRSLAEKDPALFLDGFSIPILINKCFYSPNLFPEIKLRIDRSRIENRITEKSDPTTSFYLTSSYKTNLDQNVKESLAGRIQIYSLSGLSVTEISIYNDIYRKRYW